MKYERFQTFTISLGVYAFLGFVTMCLLFILFRIILSWNYYLFGFIVTGIFSAIYLYREVLIGILFVVMSLIWIIPKVILVVLFYPFRTEVEYLVNNNNKMD